LVALNNIALPQELDSRRHALERRVLKSPPDDMNMAATSAGGLGIGDCSDYIDLSGRPLPIVEQGTTTGATNDYGPFSSRPESWVYYWDSGSSAAGDKTYKWTVPSTGRYTISLRGSSYDAGLLVYRFTCPTEPSYPVDFVCGSDDAYELSQPELYCQMFTEGQELLIVVDGRSNRSGNYTLSINEYHPASDIDAFIDDMMQTYHIPGLSACAIRNGEIVWSGNYGYANIAQGLPPTEATPFLLASISKTFVSVALMQLWEDGLFGLDDDINPYLPWQVRNPIYPDSAITFRMLMTHTSTIADNWNILLPLTTWGGDSPLPLDEFLMNYLTPGGLYYSSANFNFFAPGDHYSYCNVGAALAGLLVERINPGGLSLEEYCQQSVFGPLGMDATSWFLANLNIEEVAVPYQWSAGYVPLQHSGFPIYPAAQLRTSSAQLARHLIAFQQHGQIDGHVVLDSTTVELMTTVQSMDPNWGESSGLFWMTFPGLLGGRMLWGHMGGWYGCQTRMFYCPDENTAGLVLTNGEAGYGTNLILSELLEYAGATTGVQEMVGVAGARGSVVLYQNSPNPFGVATDISYYLPSSGDVSVAIYDVSGRLVETVLRGSESGGLHSVRWNAGRMPPGIYFVRLESQGISESRKLLVVR
jgi:CubicO group peptidase (beta-lactamase class C family)